MLGEEWVSHPMGWSTMRRVKALTAFHSCTTSLTSARSAATSEGEAIITLKTVAR